MLTQLSTVKARLGSLDSNDDVLLTRVINAVTAAFEKVCNRRFARTADATEEFDADQTEIRTTYFPIETVTRFEIKDNEAQGWQLIDPQPDYLIRRDCVVSLHAPLGHWRQRARLTYNGGYVMPGDEVKFGQSPLPEDIQQACVEQVACWYQNRNTLGLLSVTAQSSVTSRLSQEDLLPTVKSLLKPHIRY